MQQMKHEKKIGLDDESKILFFLLLIGQFYFQNGWYLFIGFCALYFLIYKVQQPYKPSIFTILLFFHFLQIISGVLLSNYLGKDINFRSEALGDATLYSCLGLVALFVFIIYFQNKIPSISVSILFAEAKKLSTYKSFQLYLTMFFIANSLGAIAFGFSGLAQFIISFISIKWFIYVIFGLQVILKKEMVKEFSIVTIIEFLLGFLSFFSNFKIVLFFLLFIFLIKIIRLNINQIILSLILFLFAFFLGVKWTSIKGEYRAYLNQGSKSQSVYVDKESAFNKLMELSDDESDFNKSAAQFFDRLQYTYHFAKTIERVPYALPYENGEHVSSIINYVVTPRLLNPDKKVNESSKNATKYTGIAYLGIESGTSFSLGYFADCYIDFGLLGMLVYLLLLGFIYGSTYFYFVKKTSNNLIINYAIVPAIYMETIAFELDGVYLFGRLLSNLLVFFIIKHFLVPRIVNYIEIKKA